MNLAALGTAAAQAAGDYRALVCIFLFGGNDAYNMVLPTDTASFANYTAVRNQAPDSIALLAPGTAPNAGAAVGTPARLGGVLPIAPPNAQGRTFALHPQMGALQTLFNTDRRLAIVPNVGPLVIPTTKPQYGQSTHPKPISLFSHNDQQNTWQALAPEGATQGWGGRLADMLMSRNAKPVFTAISSERHRRCGWPVPACASTRCRPAARSAWASTATAASTTRPMSAPRCSASCRARAARTCSKPTWPRWPAVRSMPSWRCAAR